MAEQNFLEHVYALAGSGQVASVSELRKELRRQGYSDSQLFGRSLIAELGRIIRAARDGLDQPPPKPEKRSRRLLSAEERSEAAKRGAATRSAARRNGGETSDA